METPFYKYALMRNFIREILEQEAIEKFIKEKFNENVEMRNRFCNEDVENIKELIEEVIEYITMGKGRGREEEVLRAIINSCNST
ncbi:MAG: hypothetical protein RRA45_05410 [Saccharolobus sp.]|jgi:DNA-directed RNA polymerase subunit F|uniref:hypothetical protein n=1 Tax=Saccharolobus sp. TaxID=2100761 RepID=UPI0028CCCCC7|nr:hypothetical protein [Saccharolobus sp.]MDT7861630.1 hypothetical protein [Saccharolobus sp.]